MAEMLVRSLVGCVIMGFVFSNPLTSFATSCPDTSAGESAQDCPWAGIARDLLREPSPEGKEKLLLSEAKALSQNIREDSKRSKLRKLWGVTHNFDEAAKGTIVDSGILQVLHGFFGEAEMVPPHVHAGLEHTYGYLFSLLKTPYGFKRARWVSGEIEKGFALPRGSLGPLPAKGSLFSNVTYFAGSIAFMNEKKQAAELAAFAHHVDPALARFHFSKLDFSSLEETVDLDRKILIRTDFVPFSAPVANSRNTHVLIYSVVDPQLGGARLLTMFPVEAAFVERALDSKSVQDPTVKARYNAYIQGLTEKGSVLGNKKVLKTIP